MNYWEKKVAYPDGEIATFQQGENARYFRLVAEPIRQNILSNVAIEGLGYNGSTPGPLLIVEQGEWVVIEAVNLTDKAHGLHVHGLSKPNYQDGIPNLEPTPLIKPGESFTYQFQAWQSGTFFYHSSDVLQISQGLLGPFIVIPKTGNIAQIPDHDYVLVLQQWQLDQPELGKVMPGNFKVNKFERNPNFFTINGKSFPITTPMYTRLNEKVRMRFINKSSNSHSMHIHGHDFEIVQVNGFPRANLMDDTINIASGQRYDVEFISNNPGIWAVNGTKNFHQTNNGEAPGGMTTRLIYTN